MLGGYMGKEEDWNWKVVKIKEFRTGFSNS